MDQDDSIRKLEDYAYELGIGDWESRQKHVAKRQVEQAMLQWPNDKCWFCETRSGIDKFSKSAQLTHESRKHTGYKQYNVLTQKFSIKIPICKECDNLIKKKRWLTVLLVCSIGVVMLGLCIIPANISALIDNFQDVGMTIFNILFLLTSILIVAGFPLGYFIWRKKIREQEKTIGLLSGRKLDEFPVLTEIKKLGWNITL